VGSQLDVIVETTGGGTDTVFAEASYTLQAGVEVEYLSAGMASNLTLVGNEFAQTITGTFGNDTLDARRRRCADRHHRQRHLRARRRGDRCRQRDRQRRQRYHHLHDHALAGFLRGNREPDVAGSGAINGTGNALNNVIIGNAKANVLTGGAGIDTETGGAGSDFFVFNAPLSAANRDIITDFSHVADTFRLENAVMTKLVRPGR